MNLLHIGFNYRRQSFPRCLKFYSVSPNDVAFSLDLLERALENLLNKRYVQESLPRIVAAPSAVSAFLYDTSRNLGIGEITFDDSIS